MAAVSGMITFGLGYGAHWINLESTYSERRLYEGNPPNSLWVDLASGFPLYIPALIFGVFTIALIYSVICGFSRGETQKMANMAENPTPHRS